MSHGICETVKVETKDGYKVINKTDLADDDKIYQPTEKKAAKKPEKKAAK